MGTPRKYHQTTIFHSHRITSNNQTPLQQPCLHAQIKALPVQPQPLPLPATAKLSLNSLTSRVSLASNSQQKEASEDRWNPCWAERTRKAIDRTRYFHIDKFGRPRGCDRDIPAQHTTRLF